MKVAALFGAILLGAGAAAEPDKKIFDLAAGDAAATLVQFTRQSNEQVVYFVNKVRGVKTNRVKGAFTTAEALNRMLASTDLVWKQDETARAFTVYRPNAPAPVSPATLPAASALSRTARAPENPGDDRSVFNLRTFLVTIVNRTGKPVERIPGAVNVVPSSSIQQDLALTEDVTKTLERSLPGYSPSRGALTSFGETLRGRVPLYLLDGIPQSTPLRNGSRAGSSFVDLSFIDRIEVINGPSATEGLGASGGIINFITKTPRAEGNETNIDTKISTQFNTDGAGVRAGFNFGHNGPAFDFFIGLVFDSRPMDYDAHGRALGIDSEGTAEDSLERALFVKVGRTFGVNHAQRLQLAANFFNLTGGGNYMNVYGDRALGITNSAIRGTPAGRPASNTMSAISLNYTLAGLLGGTFTAQLYEDHEALLYPAVIDAAKQDPAFAPVGTLADQSRITAHKYGVRSIFVRPNLLVAGLEADLGFDYLNDQTAQGLALTHRVWVPPLKYRSLAPFAQFEYERGPLTFRGGTRNENASLHVDDFTTVASAKSTFVQGGRLAYSKALNNLGAVLRLGAGWSLYVAYSEGFSVPDVGRAIRGIDVPRQSVANRAELVPLLVTNREVGANWRGKNGSFGVSIYRSYSAVGSTLVYEPVTKLVELSRVPTLIRGVELTGEVRINPAVTINGIFSRIVGKTSAAPGGPLDLVMGSDQVSPAKLVGELKWRLAENKTLNLSATNLQSRHINLGRFSPTGGSLQEDFQGYTRVDASFRYRTRHRGTWSLGVENLFNQYYLQAIDSSAVVSSASPPYFFAGRGRMLSLSNSLRF